MKILHLLPYSPVPQNFGGAIRIYQLLKRMSEKHEVTVLSYGSPQDDENIRRSFYRQVKEFHVVPHPSAYLTRRLVQCYSLFTNRSFLRVSEYGEPMQRAIDKLCASNDFDIVQTEFTTLGCFRLDTDAITIVDAHNVEYDNFRRMAQNTLSPIRKFYYNQQYIKIRREEIDTCRKHDAIFVTSAMDKACFDRDIPSVPKYIIPNGVDTGYFQPFTSPPEPHSLVFTGMMAYVPNYDGMLYFLDNIFPLIQREVPDVKIYIVGSRPPRKLMNRASENIVITGFVEDVRPYVSRASVYVVPLRMGGGTRLKVLEAMAMKKPIVTTSIGCEGIDVGHNESVLIADDPQDFAEQVIQLFRTSALTHTLVRNGYDLVRTRYDWGIIGDQVDAAYQSLIKLSTSSDRPRKRAFAMDLTTTVTP